MHPSARTPSLPPRIAIHLHKHSACIKHSGVSRSLQSILTSAPARRGLPVRERKFLVDLLHQQCWCWGQDIRSADNLLVAYGFSRDPAPSCPGSTRYSIALEDGSSRTMWQMNLWGFGVALSDDRGRHVFVSRSRRGVWLLPSAVEPARIHNLDEIEPFIARPMLPDDITRARAASRFLARTCEAYERWIAVHAPSGHRAKTLTTWEHPVARAEHQADAWRRARELFASLYAAPVHALTFP